MDVKRIILDYLKQLIKRWYLVVIALFDFMGVFIQSLLHLEIPLWGNLLIFLIVFIIANFLIYRDSQINLRSIQLKYESQINDLNTQIAEIKNLRPHFQLGFWTGEEIKNVQRLVVLPPPEAPDIEKMVQQEDIIRQPKSSKTDTLASQIANVQSMIESIKKTPDEYEKDCQDYLKKYRDYLKAQYEYDFRQARMRSVNFVIENIGKVPAHDIVLVIDFPDDLIFISGEDDKNFNNEIQNVPVKPERPTIDKQPFLSKYTDLSTYIHPPFTVNLPDVSPKSIRGPFIKPRNSTEVSYEIDELMHNFIDYSLERTEFIVPDKAIGQVFELGYTIHATNLPEPQKGILVLEINLEQFHTV